MCFEGIKITFSIFINFCTYLFSSLCSYVRDMCVDVRGQRQEVVLSFYHVGPRDGIQAIGKSSHQPNITLH